MLMSSWFERYEEYQKEVKECKKIKDVSERGLALISLNIFIYLRVTKPLFDQWLDNLPASRICGNCDASLQALSSRPAFR